MSKDEMSFKRPYLVRALSDWIVDNDCTPYLLVNADYPQVMVPLEYITEGKIILNVNPSAVRDFYIGSDFVRFSARFSGKAQEIYIPIGAVLAVYAKENGQGMFFDADEIPPPIPSEDSEPPPDASPSGGSSAGRPKLKVVK